MERAAVEATIRSAFAGVRLGGGVSLRQGQVLDDWGGGVTRAEYEASPLHEVTDDWQALDDSDLLGDGFAHLDAEGLRYYLPAMMLWLLDHHDDDTGDLTAIGAISAMAFSREDDDRYQRMYATFTDAQRTAIATYLTALPDLIDLDIEDSKRVARTLQTYWGQFLPRDAAARQPPAGRRHLHGVRHDDLRGRIPDPAELAGQGGG